MSETGKDFSIVIPMYNSEKTIETVLKALEKQTALSSIREVIIVNDGSYDKSPKLVKKFMEKSHLEIKLVNQENHGVSFARNIGMKLAKSSWIAFNDSDDYWYPQKLERQIAVLNMNPDIDFLGCNHSDKELRILTHKINYLYKANIKDICLKMFPQPSTVIMRKKIFDQIGGFDITQRYAEDGNYFLKICSKYNYFYMPEKLINYGSGKREFGVSGLSANLYEMYHGNIKNILELKNDKLISLPFYLFLRIYYWGKYLRRIIMTMGNR